MSLDIAIRNVAYTYASLARTLEHTNVWDDREGLHARGPIRHALGSFTLAWDAPPTSLPDDSWFALYTSGMERRPAPEGFRSAYDLIVMVAPPRSPETYPGPMKKATSRRERLAVARFMARQFFPASSREMFSQLVAATSEAEDLDLIAFQSGLMTRVEAAVMLSRTEESIGLYNLCVDGVSRRQGKGSKIVHRVLQEAGIAGVPVTLQCEPKLAPWYQAQGFSFAGVMQAWSPLGD